MLVKLGEVWVDPTQIVYISPSEKSVMVSIKDDGFAGAIPIAESENWEYSRQLRDEFADIVNAALNTQTYGGVPDEEEKPEGI